MKKWTLIIALWILLSPQKLIALNQGEQRTKIDSIVVHSIGGPECKDGIVKYSPAVWDAEFWINYFNNHEVLGVHYVVDREGVVEPGVPETHIAHHARGHNDHSIGIELVNKGDGNDPYTEKQLDALIRLLNKVSKRWEIPHDRIFAHAELSDKTFECGGNIYKSTQDPGEHFPWVKVRERLHAIEHLDLNSCFTENLVKGIGSSAENHFNVSKTFFETALFCASNKAEKIRAYTQLAEMYVRSGELNKATRSVNQVFKIQPQHRWAMQYCERMRLSCEFFTSH